MRPLAQFTLLIGLTAVVACSGGDSGGTTPPPPPVGTLTLSLSGGSATLPAGGATAVTISIARGGSFAGNVTLTVSGLPSGVTGSFVPATLDASTTSAVLNLAALTSAAVGTSTLTVTATGTGVTAQTATATLTVTQPAISIAATPAALSIMAGVTGQTTVSIGRSSGYTAAVTLALDNPPAGITATFNTSPTTANSSVVTVSVAATVVAGSYPVTIKATAPGAADKTVSLSLTVTPSLPIGFTASVDPVEFELPAGQGWGANGIVTVQRANGFTGAVTFSVQGLSFPAFVGITPSSLPASQTQANMLSLAVDGATPGVYSGVVRVTAAGFAEQQVPIRVRVSAPTTGAITWSFCRSDRVPKFMAVKDGNGAWRHIVPGGPAGATQATPATFAFDITQATGAVAMIGLGEKTSSSTLIEGHHWQVFYMTRQEIVDMAAAECVDYRDVTTRRATGTLTGYQSFDAVIASASHRALANAGSTGPLNTSISVQNIAPGPFDLMLSRTSFVPAAGPDISVLSLILRRANDPANNGTLAPASFATEGVAPASAPLTLVNTSGETVSKTMTFRTAGGLNTWLAASAGYTNTTRTWWGWPTAQLVTGDMHQLVLTTGNTTARRQVIHFSRTVQPLTVTFGLPLASPTVVAPLATPWLVRAVGVLLPDYASRVSMYVREQDPDPRTFILMASRGYLGAGTQYDISIPDLSAATGFTAFWNVRRGRTVSWIVTGGEGGAGDPINDTFCTLQGYCPVRVVDGATYKSAQATGTTVIP